MAILVGTDFSPCSRTAIRLASALARRKGVSLVLVHAVGPPPVTMLPAIPIAAARWESEMSMAAELAIARAAGEIRDTGVAVQTRVVLGSAAHVILDAAREKQFDLVVLGSHGRSGAARLFLGSVTERVVSASTCPVLVTREDLLIAGQWEGREPLRLVGAIDGSTTGHTTLSWMKSFGSSPACDLSLVRLYSPPDEALRYGLSDPWTESDQTPKLLPLLHRDLLRDARTLMGGAPSQVRFRARSSGLGEILTEEAHGLEADALVVGIPRRRTGRATLITPAAVLRHASLPVFCIPEGTAPSQRDMNPVRSVLIASDLSEAAKAVILPAYGLLRAGGGRVELLAVHVVGSGERLDGAVEGPLDQEQRAKLESMLVALIPSEVATFQIETKVSVVEGRSAAEAILAAAERLGVDIVAMGSHGRSGLKRLALGSVAEEVARKSPRPVFIVRSIPGDRPR
jgi:nucleotide-binding universal stress UspA family protein